MWDDKGFPRRVLCDMLARVNQPLLKEVLSCANNILSTTCTPFERTSKRRRGFPSETHIKRGYRVVHGDKELKEKLGRNDPCPCQSGRRF